METEGTPGVGADPRLARLLTCSTTRRNQFFAAVRRRSGSGLRSWRSGSMPGADRAGRRMSLSGSGRRRVRGALRTRRLRRGEPGDPFPELSSDPAGYEAEAVGHPLIADGTASATTSRSAAAQVLIVSGSNMSGKSTLLRTVGINAVLALAGAPVRARRLRLSPLAIGATLRIQDSLQAGARGSTPRSPGCGRSWSCPRVRCRCCSCSTSCSTVPTRTTARVGAEAVVRGLIDRGAIGLVTTHDLALAQIADALAPRAINVHFEDQLVDGQMHFDYRMRRAWSSTAMRWPSCGDRAGGMSRHNSSIPSRPVLSPCRRS